MCVSVYVNIRGSMCQARLKQRWNTRKLVKGRQKSKEPLLPITLIATCRKRLPNIVTLTRVRIRESRKDVLRFVTVADRSAAIIFARRIILGFTGFAEHNSTYSMSTHWRNWIHAILFDHLSTSLTISFFRLCERSCKKVAFSKQCYLIIRILVA